MRANAEWWRSADKGSKTCFVHSAAWAWASHFTSLDFGIILWEASEGVGVWKSLPISEVRLMRTGQHLHKWKLASCALRLYHPPYLCPLLADMVPQSHPPPSHDPIGSQGPRSASYTAPLRSLFSMLLTFPFPTLHQPIHTYQAWVPFPLAQLSHRNRINVAILTDNWEFICYSEEICLHFN